MDPARASELSRQVAAIAALLLDAMISGSSEGDDSTASRQERMLLRTLKPLMRPIRGLLLDKISRSDPARIEIMMGATATALESILYYAPGDSLPRYMFDFGADGELRLAPLPAAEPVAESA
jgi:hypothetical protein